MKTPLAHAAQIVPTKLFVRLVALQYRVFERELSHIHEFVPEDRIAIDVGAWWGPWTLPLSRRVPEVHAFEPNREVYDALRHVVPGNVVLHNQALSDRTGTAVLWSPGRGRGTEGRSSLSAAGHEAWVDQVVDVVRLDDLGISNVGFLKVDVEGHELSVLSGAANLIEHDRPNVFVEVEDAHHRDVPIDDVFSYFSVRGYIGSFYRHGRWHPLEAFDRDGARRAGGRSRSMGLVRITLTGSGRYIHNFLFVPNSAGPRSDHRRNPHA